LIFEPDAPAEISHHSEPDTALYRPIAQAGKGGNNPPMPLSSRNNTAMDVKKPIKHSKHQSAPMALSGVRLNSTATAAATKVLVHNLGAQHLS
jgi:hypothetical protein